METTQPKSCVCLCVCICIHVAGKLSIFWPQKNITMFTLSDTEARSEGMSKRRMNKLTLKRKPGGMAEAASSDETSWSWEGAAWISSVGFCSLPTWEVSLGELSVPWVSNSAETSLDSFITTSCSSPSPSLFDAGSITTEGMLLTFS